MTKVQTLAAYSSVPEPELQATRPMGTTASVQTGKYHPMIRLLLPTTEPAENEFLLEDKDSGWDAKQLESLFPVNSDCEFPKDQQIKGERGALLGRCIMPPTTAQFNHPDHLLDIPCDLCFPCDAMKVIDYAAVDRLASNGWKGVIESGHSTVTMGGHKILKKRGLLYGPHNLTLTGSAIVHSLGPNATDAMLAKNVSRILKDVKSTATDFLARGDWFGYVRGQCHDDAWGHVKYNNTNTYTHSTYMACKKGDSRWNDEGLSTNCDSILFQNHERNFMIVNVLLYTQLPVITLFYVIVLCTRNLVYNKEYLLRFLEIIFGIF
jgi:hypothetical protein